MDAGFTTERIAGVIITCRHNLVENVHQKKPNNKNVLAENVGIVSPDKLVTIERREKKRIYKKLFFEEFST